LVIQPGTTVETGWLRIFKPSRKNSGSSILSLGIFKTGEFSPSGS
jgi:hypothetical protein